MIDILSQARVDFCFQQYEEGPLTYKTVFSNIVSTVIADHVLSIVRKVSKERTEIFDIITYTVTITNLTHIVIPEMTYRDEPSESLLFIDGSVYVDEQAEQSFHPVEGFLLIDVAPLSCVVISFSSVIQWADEEMIQNKTILTFPFSSNHLVSPINLELFSNETITYIDRSIFRDFHVNESFAISTEATGMVEDISLNTRIDGIHTKLVNCVIKQLPKKQDLQVLLLLCDLVVQYELSYQLVNNRLSYTQTSNIINTSSFTRAFRTSLFVPHGIKYSQKASPICEITNVHYELFSNLIFCDLSLLISI